MVAVRVSPFGGMVPAADDKLLAPTNAALAQDTWVYSGAVVGLPVPKVLRALTNVNAGKVYRIPNNFTDSLHLTDSTWMEFAHPDTDVIRSQVIDDTFNRFYWVSPLDVPRYMTLAQIIASAPALAGAYMLGIPQPGAITVTVAGGTSTTLKSVAYVQTFVSAYGEEGPPSAPFSLTGQKVDATFTVHLAAADPGDLGTNRNLTKSRIYRTVTATDGTTTYFFVAEVAIATATYADTATDAVVALNAQLASTTWSAPPSDLTGWVSLGNGMVAAFRDKEIWFCEPFRMHSWPAAYVLVVEYPIVGLGVQNQQLVVVTEGFAYLATGITPSAMSLNKLAGLTPGTSRGSIVSTTDGVYFSTPAGLALVSGGSLVIATQELIRKDKWNALVQINTLRAAQLGRSYYAYGQGVQGVFQVNAFDPPDFQQSDFAGALQGLLIDPTSAVVAFNKLTTATPMTNVITDAWSGEVLLIRDGNVLQLDISDVNQPKNPYVWRSKIFQVAQKKNVAAAKIFFTTIPGLPALNPVQNMAQVQTLAADQWGLFRVYADNQLIMTREIRTTGELMRLPSGFEADYWQFEVESRLQIDNIQAATSVQELQTV